jgi:hypothetical protein
VCPEACALLPAGDIALASCRLLLLRSWLLLFGCHALVVWTGKENRNVEGTASLVLLLVPSEALCLALRTPLLEASGHSCRLWLGL